MEAGDANTEVGLAAAVRPARGSAGARRWLRHFFSRVPARDYAVRLWDGEVWLPPAGGQPRFTLVFRSPGVVRAMFLAVGALSFGEAYIDNELEVEGPLLEVFPGVEELLTLEWSLADKLRALVWLWGIPAPRARRQGRYAGIRLRGRADSPASTRAAVAYHYDHPEGFWRAWLDESLCYSCAYFDSAETSLAAAQRAKLDYVCRKLRLQPGQRFLDLGCGWGALVIHAALHYGVEALGLTLSPQQAEVARARLTAAGGAARCRVEVADFLTWTAPHRFDRIASVGALEHVSEVAFRRYFDRVFGLLHPGGQYLNHAITRAPTQADRRGASFMQRYVFPGHFLASIGRTVWAAEQAGFEVRDVESLREHYALTLRHWLGRLEQARTDVERATDPLSYRVFRLYLAGSAHEFTRGRLNLHQTLLIRPRGGPSGLPWTRRDWYAASRR